MEKYITRIIKTDQLIRRKATGSPKALAEKLNVSESTVYRIVRILKENMKLSVTFSKEYNSYVYTRENEKLNFENLTLTTKE
ncbi:HTH domain-containing protein [Fulvivirgaceae bacterium PWU4]|uniref:HTH domain-containing protein n=1 Tax=Chryseosolibacter histidini TaxID=2782349 RepID=A0AAP2DKK4_9BACT|nr:HTH domain-containing protein [Chryseosolibacter histidini]MBT1695579.1 HTH domain-containing protein [Chryseosolibacter histidini]